jgi:hypothetical protein
MYGNRGVAPYILNLNITRRYVVSYVQGRPLPMGEPGQSEQYIKICKKTKKKQKTKLCNIVTATSLLD